MRRKGWVAALLAAAFLVTSCTFQTGPLTYRPTTTPPALNLPAGVQPAIFLGSVTDLRGAQDKRLLLNLGENKWFLPRPLSTYVREAFITELRRMGIGIASSVSEAAGRLEAEIRPDVFRGGGGLEWEFSARVKLYAPEATQPFWETELVGTERQSDWLPLDRGFSLAMTDAISKLGQAVGFAKAVAQLSGVGPEVAKAPPTPPAPAPTLPEGREARVPAPAPTPEWTSSGSGFLLRGTSHILTSLHVVEGAKEVRVSFPSGESYTGRVVAKDANNDLAVVQLQGMPARNEGFTFDPGTRVEVGEEVHALGYPLGPALSRQPSLVSGQVSAATGPRDNIAQFRMTAPINEGNSGGPLLNAKGVLVGIASAGLVRAGVEAIRFGTKVSAAALILSQAALARPFDIRVAPRRESYTPQELFREFSPHVVLVETK